VHGTKNGEMLEMDKERNQLFEYWRDCHLPNCRAFPERMIQRTMIFLLSQPTVKTQDNPVTIPTSGGEEEQ